MELTKDQLSEIVGMVVEKIKDQGGSWDRGTNLPSSLDPRHGQNIVTGRWAADSGVYWKLSAKVESWCQDHGMYVAEGIGLGYNCETKELTVVGAELGGNREVNGVPVYFAERTPIAVSGNQRYLAKLGIEGFLEIVGEHISREMTENEATRTLILNYKD